MYLDSADCPPPVPDMEINDYIDSCLYTVPFLSDDVTEIYQLPTQAMPTQAMPTQAMPTQATVRRRAAQQLPVTMSTDQVVIDPVVTNWGQSVTGIGLCALVLVVYSLVIVLV